MTSPTWVGTTPSPGRTGTPWSGVGIKRTPKKPFKAPVSITKKKKQASRPIAIEVPCPLEQNLDKEPLCTVYERLSAKPQPSKPKPKGQMKRYVV